MKESLINLSVEMLEEMGYIPVCGLESEIINDLIFELVGLGYVIDFDNNLDRIIDLKFGD